MTDVNKILIGKIVAFHGVRGDVRVQTYTENPSDFKTLPIIGANFAAGDFRFIRAIPHTNIIIAHIRGFVDRNTAETLRGTELFVMRDALPPAGVGEYYQADLIGMTVVRDGVSIGVVSGFQNFGAGDIIELDNGDMVAFRGAIVDTSKRNISVK